MCPTLYFFIDFLATAMQYFRAPLVRHLNVLRALTMKHFTKIPLNVKTPWGEGWGNHHSLTRDVLLKYYKHLSSLRGSL